MLETACEFRRNPTPSERTLWQALRLKRCNGIKFHRQRPIDHFIVDFYAPAVRLAVEVDGAIHAEHQEMDQERQAYLKALGITFLRFSAEQVEHDLDHVLAAIIAKLKELA